MQEKSTVAARGGSWRALLAAIMVLLPLALLGWRTLERPLPEVIVHGDLALMELATLRATRFEQLTGAYSRFKFHHPGPALFYWLAPFYELGGHRYGALSLGMLILNGAAFGLVLLAPLRLAGDRAALLAAPALLLLFLHAGPHLFWSVWNPDAGILPLAATLACAFAVAGGRLGFLPSGVFMSSMAAQSHVLFVVPVGAIWLATALYLLRRRRYTLPIRTLLATGAVAGILWYPVVLEEWRGEPGNLSVLLNFRHETEQSALGSSAFAAGRAAIAESFWAPLGWGGLRRLDGEAAQRSGQLSWLLLVLVVAGLVAAWRRRSPLGWPAALLLMAMLLGCFWTLASLTGELHPYLTRFLVPVAPLAWILVGCALSTPRLGDLQPAYAASAPPVPSLAWRGVAATSWIATAALSLLSCQVVLATPNLGDYLDQYWGQRASGKAVPRILQSLAEHGLTRPYLGIADPSYWHYAAAVVDQLEKRGGHPVVYTDWDFMFGAPSLRGAHDCLLLLGSNQRNAAADPLATPALTIDEPPLVVTVLPLPPPFSAGRRSCLRADDTDANLFLRQGFYEAEEQPGEEPARWSRFESSILSIRLLPGRPYRFTFEAAPFEAGLPQVVSLRWNGNDVGAVELHNGWRHYSLPIPAPQVQPVNEVELRYSHPVVPREVSDSHDQRCLAVRFRQICFVEGP